MKLEKFLNEYRRSIVCGGTDDALHCTVCNMDLQTRDQAEAHIRGKKHARRRRQESSGLECREFDDDCRSNSLLRIIVIGDCHGGRSLNLMSPLVSSNYYGGTIFSWVSGRRTLPPLSHFLANVKPTVLNPVPLQTKKTTGLPSFSPPQGINDTPSVVLVFSYGEIDVRMHASKWFSGLCCDGGDVALTALELATQYVDKVSQFVNEKQGILHIDNVVPIILAIPPPSNARDNPQAPFVGTLDFRVQATRALNVALDHACRSTQSPPSHSNISGTTFKTPSKRSRTPSPSPSSSKRSKQATHASILSSPAPPPSSPPVEVSSSSPLAPHLSSKPISTESSTNSVPVYFTGIDTWDFATVHKGNSGSLSHVEEGHTRSPCLSMDQQSSVSHEGTSVVGSLLMSIADGHVHVQSSFCRPVHDRVRAIIREIGNFNNS